MTRSGRAVLAAVLVAGAALLSPVAASERPVTRQPPRSAEDDAVAAATPSRLSMAGFVVASGRTIGRFDDYTVAVRSSAITVRSHGTDPLRLTLDLVGGALSRPVAGTVAYRATHFTGSRGGAGRTVAVRRWVRYRNVYPGIDLVLRNRSGDLEYDFIAAPGADPDLIRLDVRGSAPVRRAGGDLVVATRTHELRQAAPVVFQETAGGRRRVPGAFRLAGQRVTFAVGPYDATDDLVIDPRVSYSTYLGGPDHEDVQAVGIDAAGRVYLGGVAWGGQFPTGTSVPAGKNVYVARLTRSGALEHIAFIGGDSEDRLWDMAVAPDGSVGVAGTTWSTDFPAVNAYQSEKGSIYDSAYLLKLQPGGDALAFSTYLSGTNGSDGASSVALGPTGDVYVSGHPGSTDFPLLNAWSQDWRLPGFVARFDNSGQPLFITRFMVGGRIAVGGDGAAYIAGTTAAPGLTVKNAYQPSLTPAVAEGGAHDGFVGKLSASGSTLGFATYLGGSSGDLVSDVAVDSANRPAVVGYTSSQDYPTAGGVSFRRRGYNDTFVTRLTASGSALSYSTLYGGASGDEARGAAFDTQDRLHVTGTTTSWDLPVRNALQRRYAGGESDAFWLTLAADGSAADVASYLGAGGADVGTAVATSGAGRTVLAGSTGSAFFPTARPWQAGLQDDYSRDLFVTSIGAAPDSVYGLTVQQVGSARGTVGSYGSGITCGADCSQTYAHGTMVNLNWTTPEGVKFSGWSSPQLACAGVFDCAFPIDQATTVNARFDEAIPPTPPVITLRPDRRWQTQPGVNVDWHATDSGTGVANYDVKYRAGHFIQDWLSATTLASANRQPIDGDNYCFAALARDKVRNTSDLGLYQCTAFPHDDAWLTASPEWTRFTERDGHYLGTYSRATAQGARLVTDHTGGYRFAVLVTRCPECGVVRVQWKTEEDGPYRKLRDIDLAAPSLQRKQVVQVASWDRWDGGWLRFVVVSSGKPVIIDGYYRQYLLEEVVNR